MRMVFSFVICFLLMLPDLFAQNIGCSIGIDMIGIIKGTAGIEANYAFSEKWSFSSSFNTSYSRLLIERNDEEAIHKSELSDESITLEKPKNFHTESFSFRYWPAGAYNGTFVSIGAEYGNKSGFDYTIGLGYSMRIWKDLFMRVRYEAALKKMIAYGNRTGEGLALHLCYNF